MKEKQETIQQVLEILGSEYAQKLSVGAIAHRLHYSASGLRKIFHKATGESILDNLLRVRIEKAQKLLSDTRLPVSEIGYEIGFSNHEHFTRTFRRRTGMSPVQFRKQFDAGASSGLSENGSGKPYFHDGFRGNRLGPWWKSLGENWVIENGTATGTTKDSAGLFLRKPLPENFEASFEARFSPGATDLTISLGDLDDAKRCWEFRLASQWAPLSELKRRSVPVQWSGRASLSEDRWYAIRLRLRDDLLCLWVDAEKSFSFSDPFPPVYAQRCALSLGIWYGQVRFRNFVVRDLGFSLFVRSIRQADALYNEGLFDAARERYMRQLQSENSSSEWMELRCKIGMTLLAQRKYEQARTWLGKIVTLPETDLWARYAKIGLLEIECQQGNTETFCRMLAQMFRNPVLRDMARSVADQAIRRLRSQGFVAQAASIGKTLITAEDEHDFFRFREYTSQCDLLFRLNRFREVEKTARLILAATHKSAKEFHTEARIVLADTYTHLGRFRMADREIKTGQAHAIAPRKCHFHVLNATNLRAQGRYEEALSLFATAPDLFPSAKEMGAFSLLAGSLLLAALDRTAEAREWTERARGGCPVSPFLNDGRKSRIYYVPLFVDGDYRSAAEILLEDIKFADDFMHVHGEQYVKAGILFELAGRPQSARRTWTQGRRQLPALRCNYYPQLARELSADRVDSLSAMPYPARDRAEMFYLVGLLCRKRRQWTRARKLFRMSVEADPTRSWAAIRAQKELE